MERTERMNKTKVIIDCDPGYDDAVALLLALGSEHLDIMGIMASSGNITIDRTYKNALRIVKFLEKQIPVTKGVSKPLYRSLHTGAEVHSISGLGGVNIPEDIEMPEEISSLEFLRETLRKQEEPITIIATGPLTNIGLLVMTYPELLSKIKELVIMGGAAVGGNVTSSAEFNIFADAEAAKVVFDSGLQIVMAGLDVTNTFQIYPEDFDKYRETGKVGVFLAECLEHYFNFYKTLGGIFRGPALHDVLPIAYVIKPELFKGTQYHVDIECKGEYTYGQTVVDFRHRSEVEQVFVLEGYDRSGVLELMDESLIRLNN